jgi:dihydroorotase
MKSDENKFILKGGNIIDPLRKYEGEYDILVSDGYIRRIQKDIKVKEGIQVYDCSNKIIAPGLIDINFHLSEPARMDRETVESASKASAMGGVTTFCCSSGDSLVIDNQAIVDYLIERSENVGYSQLLPVGAITKNKEGKTLAEIRDMTRVGIVAVSDGKNTIMNSELMRRALEYAHSSNLPVITFPEDKSLATDGLTNEGFNSLILGLKGIPTIAEAVIVVRDLILSEMTDIPIHISSVSTHASVELIKRAKSDGIKVTCDTSPHYFLLTDQELLGYKTDAKVKPPLRSEKDIASIKKALIDGTIDIITSDHTPLTVNDKDTEFQLALNGISGVETLFSLSYNELVINGDLSDRDFIKMITLNPSKLFGFEDKGIINEDIKADIIVYDPKFTYTIDKNKFKSKGKNTPFHNHNVVGKILMTVFNGRVVMKNDELINN